MSLGELRPVLLQLERRSGSLRAQVEAALLHPTPRSFLEVLAEMPNVGRDEDFARIDNETARHVFD